MKARITAMHCIIALAVLAISSSKLMAETIVFESTNEQVKLLELYTSEGCSSCPPADRWLSKLKTHPLLWKSFVPVAFHVDYWNRLGWPDRFSDQKFSMRQRRYQNEGSIHSVYTPGFVLAGKEWRQWFSDQSIPAFKASNTKVGVLRAELKDDNLQVVFNAENPERYQYLRLEYALLSFNESTEIKKGENSGHTLQHDFVVVQHTMLNALPSSESLTWSTKIKNLQAMSKLQNQGIAIWLRADKQQAPVQAAGGFLAL